jgi:hypothetical protein
MTARIVNCLMRLMIVEREYFGETHTVRAA